MTKAGRLISYTWLTVITVNLLSIFGDVTMTWTSPILTKLYSNDSDENPLGRPITEDEESWIGSLLSIGAILGPFPYGFLAERFGRKISLLCIAIPHIMSFLIFAFSKTVHLYYFSRFLGGLAVGGGYTLLPMYIAEVAEDSNRGMLSSTLTTFWTLGELIPYVVGPYLPIVWFNLLLACGPTLFIVLFYIIAPESPYYLMIKNKFDRAEKSLLKLRSNQQKAVQNEMKQIQNEIEQNEEKVSLIEFFKSKIYLKGLTISLVLIITQQATGINAILFYTEQIFEEAGVNGIQPEQSSIIIGSVMFLSSFFVPFVVDKIGRRILLLTSLIGVFLSHFSFGIYFYLKNSTSVDVGSISWLPIVSLVAFCLMFNAGIGPVPFTLSSELFPTNVKPYAATFVSSAMWTTSFFVTKFFNNLENGMGEGETFWMFGGFCLLAWFFTFIFVPETKGKSFQEIQEILYSY